jgi:hypothetical protein
MRDVKLEELAQLARQHILNGCESRKELGEAVCAVLDHAPDENLWCDTCGQALAITPPELRDLMMLEA